MGSMSNYFPSGSSNEILLGRRCSSCQPTAEGKVQCTVCSAGNAAGKTASRKNSFRVRFSGTEAGGRVGSDMVNAGIALSPWGLESQGGCGDSREVIMLSKSSIPMLCETQPSLLLFCCRRKYRSTVNRGAFPPVQCFV